MSDLSNRKNPNNGFTVLLKNEHGTYYVQHHDHTCCFPVSDVGTKDPFGVVQLAMTYNTREEANIAKDGFEGWGYVQVVSVMDNKVVIPQTNVIRRKRVS